MNMNLTQGMFRLWVVVSVLIFVATGFLSYADVKQAQDWKELEKLTAHDTLMLPVDCTNLRGVKGDWEGDLDAGKCWYSLPKFRKLYPEYADLTDKQLSKQLYDKAGMPTKSPDGPILVSLQRAGIAALLSGLLLLLGCTIRWIWRGFKNHP
jgi:hypothetical protein